MLQRATLRSFTLIAALALSVPAWAAAAPRHSVQAPAAPTLRAGNPVAWLWGQLLAVFAPNGCAIDPNGQPGTREAVTPDEGCTIDPDGRYRPAAPALAATGEGCTIDPNGCR